MKSQRQILLSQLKGLVRTNRCPQALLEAAEARVSTWGPWQTITRTRGCEIFRNNQPRYQTLIDYKIPKNEGAFANDGGVAGTI